MGRRSVDEFPQLKQYGLKACNIKGDGNCLFSALADQIFGNPGETHEIRARVVDYMRHNAEHFKSFIPVVGGERRNPKRKNAGSSSGPVSMPQVTETQRDQAWDTYLEKMAQSAVYGTNLEIVAFSKAFDTDVKIYTTTSAPYFIRGGAENAPVAYIAYHPWEHYSSIRNIDGPFTGVPNVQEKELSSGEEAEITAGVQGTVVVHAWMIANIKGMLPSRQIDDTRIKKAIEKCKGNADDAYNMLADEIISSSSGGSSIERDADSDDEDDFAGPKKRQDRRMSKATKAAQKLKQKQRSTKNIPSIEVDAPESDTDSLFEIRTTKSKLKATPKGKINKANQAETKPVATKPRLRVKLTNKASVKKPQPRDKDESPTVSDTKQSDVDETSAISDTVTDDGYQADDAKSEYSAPSRSQSFSPDASPPVKKNFILRFNKPKPRQRGPIPTVNGAVQKQKQARKEIKWSATASPKQNGQSNLVVTADVTSNSGNPRPLDQVIGIRGLTIQI